MNRNSENVTHADYIAIMFESQKNEEKLQMIVQHIPNQILYPVKALGLLVQSILSNENTSENTQVNYYQSDSGPMHMQATYMLIHLRATCRTLDERRLGFHPNKVGTHSIRTSFAMQLHLAGVRDFTIMMMGQWKILSFLSYIRPQVQEFSRDLVTQMSSGASLHFNVNHTRQNLARSTIISRRI